MMNEVLKIRESNHLQITTNFVVKRKLKLWQIMNDYAKLIRVFQSLHFDIRYVPKNTAYRIMKCNHIRRSAAFEKLTNTSNDEIFSNTERFIPFSGAKRSDLLRLLLMAIIRVSMPR